MRRLNGCFDDTVRQSEVLFEVIGLAHSKRHLPASCQPHQNPSQMVVQVKNNPLAMSAPKIEFKHKYHSMLVAELGYVNHLNPVPITVPYGAPFLSVLRRC